MGRFRAALFCLSVISFFSFTKFCIVLILNNLEVLMKRFFFGTFLAVSLFAIVGCSSSTGDDGSNDECLEDPNLAICQPAPTDDMGPDMGPETPDEF